MKKLLCSALLITSLVQAQTKTLSEEEAFQLVSFNIGVYSACGSYLQNVKPFIKEGTHFTYQSIFLLRAVLQRENLPERLAEAKQYISQGRKVINKLPNKLRLDQCIHLYHKIMDKKKV